MSITTSLLGKACNTGKGKWPVLLVWMIALGLFIQISGKIWLTSGSARNGQIYIWLLLPALIFCIGHIFALRVSVPKGYWPWLMFLTWVGLSTVWGSGGEDSCFSLMKRGLFIALYLMSIYLILNRREAYFRQAVLAAIAVVTVSALISLIHQYGILAKPWGYRAYRIDRMGIGNFANFGWPVAAGIFHGSIATWAIGLCLNKRGNVWITLAWFCSFVILALYVLMTGTRGAWFALATGTIVVIAMQRPRLSKWVFTGVGIVAVLGIIYWWGALTGEAQGRQLSGRGGIWKYYFEIMPGHWLFGYGLGTPFQYIWPNKISISPHAHSLYLQQIYDSGIISLAMMLVGVVTLITRSHSLRHNYWVRLAIPVLVFALVAMITDVERVFTRPGDYWTVFWLPVAILLAVRGDQKSN